MGKVIIYSDGDERFRAIDTRLKEANLEYEYCYDAEAIAKKGYRRLPHFEMDGRDYGLSAMLGVIARERIKNGEVLNGS